MPGKVWQLWSAGHGTSGAPEAVVRSYRRALPSRNNLLLSKHRVGDLHAAVKKALMLSTVGFDAVKHLVLWRV